MVYDEDRGVMVLFGGGWSSEYFNDVYEWDGDSWDNVVPAGIAPSPRHSVGIAYLASLGMVVVYGGRGPGGNLADTWGWDGNAWQELADGSDGGPGALSSVQAARDVHRDVMLVYGGQVFDVHASPDTWEFDGARWRRVEIDTPQGGYYGGRMVYDEARATFVSLIGRRPDEIQFLGQPCASAAVCGSGFCEDQVCCASDCDAGSCATVDAPGTCQ